MQAPESIIINIFYFYAPQDEEFRVGLESHLNGLRYARQVQSWYEGEISPGAERQKAINAFLNKADIVLLLVSPDFLTPGYGYGPQMEQVMLRHETGAARVIPILLRPFEYKGTPFDKLQPLPRDVRPIAIWENRDQAFSNVVQGIQYVVEEIREQLSKRTKEQWLDIADAHYKAERNEQSLIVYERVLQINADNLPAWVSKGKVLRRLKRYEEALEAYEQALQIDPDNFTVWFEKGMVLDDLKRNHEAIAAYDQALRINPSHIVVLVNKGSVLFRCKEYNRALDCYEKALSIDPIYARAHRGRGDVLKDYYYQYEEALAAYEKAIECDPKYAYAYYQKGKALKHIGSPQEAQEAFDKAEEFGYKG